MNVNLYHYLTNKKINVYETQNGYWKLENEQVV